ncbi:RHS repeat domain-containing protein, partial [Fangia hongkongensis]
MGKNFRKVIVMMILICSLIYVAWAGGKTIDAYQFCYDDNGNLLVITKNEIQITEYQYNNLNQLDRVQSQSEGTYHYGYYANGQRALKEDVTEATVIRFYYGKQGKLLNESYTEDHILKQQSSYFSGTRFIQAVSSENDSMLQTPLAIRKNNPLSVDLSAGVSTKESVHLDNYGRQSDENQDNCSDQHAQSSANMADVFHFDQNPFIYGQGYYDSESGLNFQRARYYDPKDARFISQDSQNLVNRYNYANSNPVMNYDPSGHNAIQKIMPHSKADKIGIALAGVALMIATDGLISSFAAPEIIAGKSIAESAVFLTKKQIAASIFNLSKNEGILMAMGYWQEGSTKAALNTAGFSHHAEGFVVNLSSAIAWMAVGTSYDLEKAMTSRLVKTKGADLATTGLLERRTSSWVLEGLASNVVAQEVSALYQQKPEINYGSLLLSLQIGIHWDLLLEQEVFANPYLRSLVGTGWGATVNYLHDAVLTDSFIDKDEQSANAYISNAMMYGAFFSTMPG